MLHADGETVLVPFGGRTEEGVFYDGAVKVRPGDDRYEELLPEARRHPAPDRSRRIEGGRQPDPEAMAAIRRIMGQPD